MGEAATPALPVDEICIVIPTLNEAATLAGVIEKCRPYASHILVIDSDSSDGTPEIARSLGARLENWPERGKGRALRHALTLVPQKITVFIDADGSHDPNDIPTMVAPLLLDKADLVVGSRWTGGSDELHGDMNKWLRRSGSRVLTTLVNWRWGARLSDIQNGFRAFPTALGRDMGFNADDFTIEQEMIMKFLSGGFRVINVPSHEYARQGGTAKLDLGRVWFRFGVVVLRHLFGIEKARLRRPRAKRPPASEDSR